MVFLLTGCMSAPSATHYPSSPSAASQQQKIVSALQAAVKKQHHVDVKLNIHILNVYNQWAYIETTGGGDPSITAVLKKENNNWRVVKPINPCLPICPSGLSDCSDAELICKNSVSQQVPTAPMQIFANPNAKKMLFDPS